MTHEHILITGGAGFIGSHLVPRLLAGHCRVTVIDNFDPFYSRSLKTANLAPYVGRQGFQIHELDIRDRGGLDEHLQGDYDVIVHLAAKAGVRHSIENPFTYQDVNVMGTQTMLEFARQRKIRHFVFASSSSVYGNNPNTPWREEASPSPISPYACSKLSGEFIGQVYSYLYGIRFIGLRFFTVYGPGQRPDMAIHKFASQIHRDLPIPLFGDGQTCRDYTYIDDIIDGVASAIEYNASRFEVINLGGGNSVSLMAMIRMLEDALGIPAKLERHGEQPGDVTETLSDSQKAMRLLGFRPKTGLSVGIQQFARWFSARVDRSAA